MSRTLLIEYKYEDGQIERTIRWPWHELRDRTNFPADESDISGYVNYFWGWAAGLEMKGEGE